MYFGRTLLQVDQPVGVFRGLFVTLLVLLFLFNLIFTSAPKYGFASYCLVSVVLFLTAQNKPPATHPFTALIVVGFLSVAILISRSTCTIFHDKTRAPRKDGQQHLKNIAQFTAQCVLISSIAYCVTQFVATDDAPQFTARLPQESRSAPTHSPLEYYRNFANGEYNDVMLTVDAEDLDNAQNLVFGRFDRYDNEKFSANADFKLTSGALNDVEARSECLRSLNITLSGYDFQQVPLPEGSMRIIVPAFSAVGNNLFYSVATQTAYSSANTRGTTYRVEYSVCQGDDRVISQQTASPSLQEFKQIYELMCALSIESHSLSPPEKDTWLPEGADFVPSFSNLQAEALEKEVLDALAHSPMECIEVPTAQECVRIPGDELKLSAASFIFARQLGLEARLVLGAPVQSEVRGKDVRVWLEVREGSGSWQEFHVKFGATSKSQNIQQDTKPIPKPSQTMPSGNAATAIQDGKSSKSEEYDDDEKNDNMQLALAVLNIVLAVLVRALAVIVLIVTIPLLKLLYYRRKSSTPRLKKLSANLWTMYKFVLRSAKWSVPPPGTTRNELDEECGFFTGLDRVDFSNKLSDAEAVRNELLRQFNFEVKKVWRELTVFKKVRMLFYVPLSDIARYILTRTMSRAQQLGVNCVEFGATATHALTRGPMSSRQVLQNSAGTRTHLASPSLPHNNLRSRRGQLRRRHLHSR
jgi:hypothetical protein